MYFMHWTRSLRRFAEQQHLASRYVLLTSRKISGPDLLVAQALADVATIGILHQRGLVHGGHHESGCHHDNRSAPSRRPVTVCGTI